MKEKSHINSTNSNTSSTTPSSKRATKKFFIYTSFITLALAIVFAVTEVLGFLIETFTSVPLLFKLTLGICYFIALILMLIFCKNKFIALLLWTTLAIAVYLSYAIFQFPQEFMSNLYFPQDVAGGYLLGFIVTVFSYCFAFNVFNRKK